MKHRNIPVFVPHLGCPHACLFCDQHTITGEDDCDVSAVDEAVKKATGLRPGSEAEIAFFGGSFTAIEKDRMLAFLARAQEYVQKGFVQSIRLSTRPDAIDPEILSLLKGFSVKTIELGIQSTDDRVLTASRRGHTAAESETACRLIRDFGFSLVGQMMVGLPDSTEKSEEDTARALIDWGCCGVRIYPTVVFSGTGLEAALQEGHYLPLSPEEAAERTAPLLALFEEAKIPVLRVGLCETDGLREGKVVAGAYHPALGELAMNALYRRKIEAGLKDLPLSPGTELLIGVTPRALSRAIGQNKRNLHYLREKYPDVIIRFRKTDGLSENEVKITLKENPTCVFSPSSSTASSPFRSAPRSPSMRE